MKKIISALLSIAALLAMPVRGLAADIMPFDVEAQSAALIDVETGRMLYSKNADAALPPASVTKVMTILLIMEEIDSGRLRYEDTVTVSAYAASMGGSQVFLEEGEQMSVSDMLKSVVIASANDGAVALAEHVAGSEEAFVEKMNRRAVDLGMKSTCFENVTGLDDDTVNHKTSAADIAVMSRQLIKYHPDVLRFSSLWMDSIRNGEFGLTNTNRLVRFYKGATGLKTGSTSKAGFCISASAERDGLHLVAVIMGSETRDKRNEAAKKLLDYGFANYSICTYEGARGETLFVSGGTRSSLSTEILPYKGLCKKGAGESWEIVCKYNERISAPVKKGDVVGSAKVVSGGEILGRVDIVAGEDVEAISLGRAFNMLLFSFFLR